MDDRYPGRRGVFPHRMSSPLFTTFGCGVVSQSVLRAPSYRAFWEQLMTHSPKSNHGQLYANGMELQRRREWYT